MRYKTGEYDNWDDLMAGLRAQYGGKGKRGPFETNQAASEDELRKQPKAKKPRPERERFYHWDSVHGEMREWINGVSVPAEGEILAYNNCHHWYDPRDAWTTYQYTGGVLDGVTFILTDRERQRALVPLAPMDLAGWLLQEASEVVIEGNCYEVDIINPPAGLLPS